MSNVLLTDKDDWLYLLLFPQPFPPPPPKKELALRLGRLMIADCPDCFINPIKLAKLSVISDWKQDVTATRCALSRRGAGNFQRSRVSNLHAK